MKAQIIQLIAAVLVFSGFSVRADEPACTTIQTHYSTLHSLKKARQILKIRSSAFLMEEDRESHGPGVFANLGLFLPSADYMNPYPFYTGSNYNAGYVLEVGNYFRFYHNLRFGLGLRATWIQLGYTSHPDKSWSEGNAWGSPLRLGPQASYAINEVMGIDLFYQLGVQYNIDWWGGENQSFAGVNHEIGLAYRFSLFTAGASMKSGSLKNIDNSDPLLPLEKVLKFSTGGIRVFVGIAL